MGKLPAQKPTQAEVTSKDSTSIEELIEQELEGKVQRRDLQAVTARITQIAVSEQFSGPMPHPKHLREYENTLPGSAERILSMAERTLDHNLNIHERGQLAEIEDTKRGMRYGAFLFGLLISCGFASIFFTDSEIVPGLFLGAAVIGGITAFIKGRNGS